MTEICPDKWIAKHGPAADSDGRLSSVAVTWALALRGYDGEQIKRGLERFLANDAVYPPDLKEFLLLIRGGGQIGGVCRWYGQDPADPVIQRLHAQRPALPAPAGAVIRTPAEFVAHARKILGAGKHE